jgi:hypothetical protein
MVWVQWIRDLVGGKWAGLELEPEPDGLGGRKDAREPVNTSRSLPTHPRTISAFFGETDKHGLKDESPPIGLLLVLGPTLSSRALRLIPSAECSSLDLADA